MSATTKVWRDHFFSKYRTLALNTIQRKVILHYHLFKNAGSSVDHILATNFGERWTTVEGEHPWSVLGTDALADVIHSNPKLLAISSHTTRLPIPVLQNTVIYPIFFVRHPIDRVSSIYHFERKQQGANFSASTARENDFSGYVQRMLNNLDNEGIVLSNFHTVCLSHAASGLTDLRQTKVDSFSLTEARAFLAALPAFGLVEHFDQSVQGLQKWLQKPFPGINFFPIRLNALAEREAPLAIRLVRIKKELGSALYKDLLNINQYDLELYRYACQLFKQRTPPLSPHDA